MRVKIDLNIIYYKYIFGKNLNFLNLKSPKCHKRYKCLANIISVIELLMLLGFYDGTVIVF